MKKVKQSLSVLLICCMFLVIPHPSLAAGSHLQIVTTMFPIYDWIREITDGVEGVEITMLLDSGVDLHSYQPTVSDIVKIASSDLFVYIGGESDAWVTDVRKNTTNPNQIAMNLMEILGEDIKTEETVEGMETEEQSEEDAEADEHIWLSLRNAQKLVKAITEALVSLDPEHAVSYQKNGAVYLAELQALDLQYSEALSHTAFRTLVFGDRFPFRYLTDDYDISYYAAFSGCSAEAEASFETIVFLAGKVDELHLPAVMTLENTKLRLAETIVANTREHDQKILALNSMQNITASLVRDGAKYLTIMRTNLEVLRQALDE